MNQGGLLWLVPCLVFSEGGLEGLEVLMKCGDPAVSLGGPEGESQGWFPPAPAKILAWGFLSWKKRNSKSVILGQPGWESWAVPVTPSPFFSCSFPLSIFSQESFPGRSCSGRLGMDLGCRIMDPSPSPLSFQEQNPS